jgi:hypothetical protein
MKAVVLATAMSAIYLGAMTVAFLFARPETLKARLMILMFLSTLPIGVALHYFTPFDLGFLQAQWCEQNRILDLAFFFFIYTAAFFGFILQLYNLADRGFSLRIVIDIDETPSRWMTVDDVMALYSAGRGIQWMYQKRIDDMAALELIRIKAGIVEPTASGRRLAARFAWLRRFLRVVE